MSIVDKVRELCGAKKITIAELEDGTPESLVSIKFKKSLTTSRSALTTC